MPEQPVNWLTEAKTAWSNRDLFHAQVFIDNALNQNPTGSDRAYIWFMAGVISRETGDTTKAIQFFQDIQALWDEFISERAILEGSVWYNLALAFSQQKQLQKAVAAYQEAYRHFQNEHLVTHAVMAMHNLAWLFCDLNQPEAAVELIDSLEYSGMLNDQEDNFKHRHKAIRAYHAYLTGQYAVAIRLADEVNTIESMPDIQSNMYWISGLVGLATGQFEGALKMSQQAIHKGMLACDARLINKANELRSKVMAVMDQTLVQPNKP